jgi:hypothetical protein
MNFKIFISFQNKPYNNIFVIIYIETNIVQEIGQTYEHTTDINNNSIFYYE